MASVFVGALVSVVLSSWSFEPESGSTSLSELRERFADQPEQPQSPPADASPKAQPAPEAPLETTPTTDSPSQGPTPATASESPVRREPATPTEGPEAKSSADTASTPQDEPKPVPPPRQRGFHRHGVGIRGGIVVIPTWILSRYLDAHANALCRGQDLGAFAAKRGLLKTAGCNFYIGAQYLYRRSRILDIIATAGYQHVHTPDGYWLDKGKSMLLGNGGADYTEIKLGMLFLQADFIARAPIVVRDNVEFGLGGGGGIGLGILFGGIYQTPIGAAPAGFANDAVDLTSCRTIDDLGDFTRCTPRYDSSQSGADPNFDPDTLSRPNPGGFADCSRDHCNLSDLDKFGYRRKNQRVPPVVPVVNLVLSARLIVKDAVAITVDGGWNTGFYFGSSVGYMFGKNSKSRTNKKRSSNKSASRNHRSLSNGALKL